MSKIALHLMVLSVLASFPGELWARGGGGRGGGFGGGGGGGRNFGGGGGRGFSGGERSFSGAGGGNRNFSGGSAGRNYSGGGVHTPSMSRSESFNRGATGAGGFAGAGYRGGAGNMAGRPSAGDLGHFLNMPQTGAGAGGAIGRVGGGGGVQGNVGRGPGNIGGAGAGGISGGRGPAGNFGPGAAGGGTKGPGGLAGGGKGPAGIGGGGKGSGTGGGTKGQGGQNAGNRGQNAGNRGENAGNRGQNAGNRTGNLSAQQQQHAQNIRNNIQGNHNNFYNNHNNWFNHGWWNNHGGAWNRGWNYWHGWGPGYWWGGLGWGALSGFMIGNWASPMYYGYGAGGNVAYQGDSVYVNGQDVGTPQQYYDQAQQLAETPAPDSAGTEDWMPLGVFAVSSTPEDDHPVMMMQMAVNKQGNIAGMYYNSSDDVSLPIQGAVDQKTQRAAWTVGDKKNTILETGIFNLTKDETPVLVHFGNQKSQEWMMVRLNKPESTPQDVFGPSPSATTNPDSPKPGPPAPSDS